MVNYYSEKSTLSINELVENNLELVKKIAWQIFGRVQKVVEVEDLIQQGMEGLVFAAQKYSPKDGVTFQQYAQLRIRGSIIDFLRKNSNLCRTTIKKKQEFEKKKLELQRLKGVEPSKDDLIKGLGITYDEFNYWEKAFEANNIQSLDQAYDEYSVLYASQLNDPEAELNELTAIYVKRGLDPSLARQVAIQLSSHDLLATHLRDELGFSPITKARPVQAAITSASMFSLGAAIPLFVTLLLPVKQIPVLVSITSLFCLGLLGAFSAMAGGASISTAVIRVTFWGAFAMALTALIGSLFGVN